LNDLVYLDVFDTDCGWGRAGYGGFRYNKIQKHKDNCYPAVKYSEIAFV